MITWQFRKRFLLPSLLLTRSLKILEPEEKGAVVVAVGGLAQVGQIIWRQSLSADVTWCCGYSSKSLYILRSHQLHVWFGIQLVCSSIFCFRRHLSRALIAENDEAFGRHLRWPLTDNFQAPLAVKLLSITVFTIIPFGGLGVIKG